MPPRKTRQKVDPRIAPVITQPTAAPVSTYARPAPSDAEQLAQALAEVNPSIGRLSQVISTQYAETKRIEGENAARIHTEQALKAGDLTRMGELPMQDNPYYMAGYKEEWGRVAAGVWQSDFKALIEQDEGLKESIDMADFDKTAGKHLADWFESKGFKRDPAFEKGFGHMKDQYLMAERLAFANGIEGKLDRKSDEALFAMVKRSITDNWGKVPLDAIAKDIALITGAHVQRGRPEGKVRPASAQAIAAAAKELGPEKGLEVLQLFELAPGEGGMSLKDQSYGTKLLEETKKDLIVEAQQAAEAARVAKQRAREELVDNINKEAMALLVKDPNANLEKFLREHPEAPPETVANLRGLQAQMQGVAYQTNQVVYRDLFNRIHDPQQGEDPTTISEIIRKTRNRNLTPEDANALIQMFESNRGRSKKDPLDEKAEPYWKLAYNFLEDVWRDKFGFVPAENVERVRNSRALLHYEWNKYKDSGEAAKKSPDELNQWFRDAADRIKGMQQSELQKALKFQPPNKPNLGDEQTAVEPIPLPDGPVLTKKDIDNYRLGKTEAVEALMARYGIPPSEADQFLSDQTDRLLKAKKQKK